MNNQEQAVMVTKLISRLTRTVFWLESDDQATELPLAQLRLCIILQDGHRTMSMLSKDLHISLSAVTQIADRLEKSGLVERVCEADDRRVKSLQLTESGKAMMINRRMRRVQRVSDVLGNLNSEDRDNAISGLKMLINACQALDGGFSDSDLTYVQEVVERIQ